MPESRLRKTRATLPEGYQFGDAGFNDPARVFARHVQPVVIVRSSAGPRIAPMLSIHRHVFDTGSGYCACGVQHWNTIEPD